MTSLLLQKLEGDGVLAKQCEQEIKELHQLFVTWFRGESPVQMLERDLCQRLLPTFSHVAPNGHMVKGRATLLQYLNDKYGCYQDRIFSIDVYNVQLLWSSGSKCLASYEEWQSWDTMEDDDDNSNSNEDDDNADNRNRNNANNEMLNDTSEGQSSVMKGAKQQFGRLSTCLLERDKKDGKFRWIHVHETWLEAEEPMVNPDAVGGDEMNGGNEDETIMTGPVPPTEMAKRIAKQSQSNNNTNTMLSSGGSGHSTNESTENADHVNDTIMSRDIAPTATTNAADGIITASSSSSPSTKKVAESSPPTKSTTTPPPAKIKTSSPSTTKVVDSANESMVLTNEDESETGGTGSSGGGDATTTEVLNSMAAESKPPPQQQPPPPPQDSSNAKKKEPRKKMMMIVPPEDKYIDPEQKFMQMSQGILTFEDEDDTNNNYNNVMDTKPVAASAIIPPQSSSSESVYNNNNDHTSGEETGGVAGGILSTLVSPPDASKKRNVSPILEKFAKPLVWENALVGISIKGFDIGTSQGVVADSIWHADTTQQLEQISQSFSIPVPKRKICLPEMIYPTAHVALEGYGIWLSWDASDALEAWAKCHQMIAVKSRISWEGVNVMKVQDAKLWEQKAADKKQQKQLLGGADNNNSDDEDYNDIAAAKTGSVFHYDWTFSTPFIVKAEGGEWIELDESGMRTELLKDLSVPILFFDDIILYEDDLHDNGCVQYSIKLRVMPTCAYILSRLFVRVDNVIVRLRETRVLIDFFGIKPQIYRDVSWKECHWDQLVEHQLPNDIKSWCCEDTMAPQKIQEWQRLIQKLPEVRLPKNYFQFAVFEF